MKNKRTAIYPGTFDPVTNGHLDIMRRSLNLFDRLVVAVALNPKKHPLFSIEERVRFIRESTRSLKNIVIHPFSNLLVDCAGAHDATVIIKGLRAVTDFEYELQMGLMNRSLKSHIETLFMIPSQEYSFLSSSFVKEIARHHGDFRNMVPKSVVRGFKKLPDLK
jgi:pantetheine-phosphate adenylyltransferase